MLLVGNTSCFLSYVSKCVCKISVVQMFILKDIVYTCTDKHASTKLQDMLSGGLILFSMVLKLFSFFLDQSSFNVALKSIHHKN